MPDHKTASVCFDSSIETDDTLHEDSDDERIYSDLKNTAEFKKKVRKVKRGNVKAAVIGAGVYLYDSKDKGLVAAYETIRPLVVRITCLSTRSAYISFRLYAQIQRVCRAPYPPDLSTATYLPHNSRGGKSRVSYKNLKKFVRIAAGIYPYDALEEQGVVFVSKQTKSVDSQIEVRMKKVLNLKIEILKKKEEATVFSPAWALIADNQDKQLILAIQGSSSVADWVTNLMCLPDDEQGTHAGMTLAAKVISDEIKDLVIAFLKKKRSYDFIVTGHSLGAGVACLLTIDWVEKLCPPEYRHRLHCYAFAPPCTIPDTMAGTYSANITSVIFGKDLVPRLSFGTSRDLLVVMQALANLEKKGRAGNGLTAEEIINAGSENSDERAEMEWKMLPSRRSTINLDTYSTDLSAETDVSFKGLTLREKEEQIERMALSMVAKPLKFGGASFHQIATILKRREAELDRQRESLKVKTKDDESSGLIKRVLWKVVKLLVGRCRTTYEHLDATVVEEDRILRNCHRELQGLLSLTANRCLVPAGNVIFVMPQLHFLETDMTPPGEYNPGQCVAMLMDRNKVSYLCQRPVWSKSSLDQHRISCYLQAFSPESLHSWPLESAVTGDLPKKIQKQSMKQDQRCKSIALRQPEAVKIHKAVGQQAADVAIRKSKVVKSDKLSTASTTTPS